MSLTTQLAALTTRLAVEFNTAYERDEMIATGLMAMVESFPTIIVSDTEPSQPTEGTIWIDTSTP